MKKLITIFLFTILAAVNIFSQSPKEADPKDVATLDAIMKAVYDVISGDAGQKRDWDRFRSLFHKDARLIPTGLSAQTKAVGASALAPDDYIKRAEPFFMKEGFYESEKARHVDIYGNIAQVFSTYEARHAKTDKTPFLRGINSFQLLNDGKRWWVMTIYWQAESPEVQIPKQYLKNKN